MKQTAYIVGSIEMMLGLLVLATTSILNEVMPKLGRVAYQAAAAGSYSPTSYQMNLLLPNAIGVVLCLLGVGSILYFFLKKPA